MMKRKERKGGEREEICWSFYRIFKSGYHWEWTWISGLDDTLPRVPSESEGNTQFSQIIKKDWLMLLWPKLSGLPSVPCERSSGLTQATVLTHLPPTPLSMYLAMYHIPQNRREKMKWVLRFLRSTLESMWWSSV